MNNTQKLRLKGFTLVELLVVMLVLVALSSITLDFTKDFAFQGRYEVTKDRYEKIKRAIIGRPDVLINGQPDISGFVADMGRLPRNIQELLVQNYCSDDYRISDNTPDATGITDATGTTPKAWCTSKTPNGVWEEQSTGANCSVGTTNATQVDCEAVAGVWSGWKGPYLTTQKPDYEENAFSDGWGNEASTTVFTDHNYGWAFCLGNSPDNATAATCYTPTNTGVGTNQLALQSKGKNGTIDITDTNYDKDYPDNQVLFNLYSWTVSIPEITVNMQAPVQNTFNCSTNGVAENACKNTANWNWFGKPECSDGSLVTAPVCDAAGETWYWFTGWPTGIQFCVGGTSTGLEATAADCTAVSGNWITKGLCSGGSSTGTESTLDECSSVTGAWREGWCVGGASTGDEVDDAACTETWYGEWPLKNSRCSNRFFITQASCGAAGHRWVEPFCTNPAKTTKATCTLANESWVIPFCSALGISANDSTYTEANCVVSGGSWGGCIDNSNSKRFCDINGGIWQSLLQDVDLKVVNLNGTSYVSNPPVYIEENGLNQNVVFNIPISNISQGRVRLGLYKAGTSDIYPPSCSGLTAVQCTGADGGATDAVLLDNNLCDNVTFAECTGAGGNMTRRELNILILPYINDLKISW